MANTQAPFGFRAYGHRDGSAPTMGLERTWIASSDTNLYFTGDPVARSSALGGKYITPFSSAVAPVYGIFAGCEYYNPTTQQITFSRYWPGTAVGSSDTPPVTAYVISDPEMTFLAQCSTTGTITNTNIGWGIAVTGSLSSQGNTATGLSVVTLAAATIGATNSFPFQIVDLYSNVAPPGVNGTDNSSAGQILVVSFNNSVRHAGVTSVST